MLIEELIEKAFCDGYEYAQKLFFLSPDGNPFTGKDIIETKKKSMLEHGPRQNDTKLAYRNTATGIDQREAWNKSNRKLSRLGVDSEHRILANQAAVHKTFEKSDKAIIDRLNNLKTSAKRKGSFKSLLKRFK